MDTANPLIIPLDTPPAAAPAPRLLRDVPRPEPTPGVNPLIIPLSEGAGGKGLGWDFAADVQKQLDASVQPVTSEAVRTLQDIHHNVATGTGGAVNKALREAGVNSPTIANPALMELAQAQAGEKYWAFIQNNRLENISGQGVEQAKIDILRAAQIAQVIENSDLPDGPDRDRLIGASIDRLIDTRVADIFDRSKHSNAPASEQEMQLASYANVLKSMTIDQKKELYRHSIWATRSKPSNTYEQGVLVSEANSWSDTPTGERIAANLTVDFSALSSLVEKPTRLDARTALGLAQALLGPEAADMIYKETNRNKQNFYYGKLGLGNKEAIDGTWSNDGTNFLKLAPAGSVSKLLSARLAESPEVIKDLYSVRAQYGLAGARKVAGAIAKEVLDQQYMAAGAALTQIDTGLFGRGYATLTPDQEANLPVEAMATKFLMDKMSPLMSIPTEIVRDTESALQGSEWYRNLSRGAARTLSQDPALSHNITKLSEALAVVSRLHPENIKAVKHDHFVPGSTQIPGWPQPTYETYEVTPLKPYSANDPALALMPAAVQKQILFAQEGVMQKFHDAFPRALELENTVSARLARYRNGNPDKGYGSFDATMDAMTTLFAVNIRNVTDPVLSLVDDPTTAPGLALGLGSMTMASGFALKKLGISSQLASKRLLLDLNDVVSYHPEKIQGFMRVANAQIRVAEAGSAAVERLQGLQGALAATWDDLLKTGKLTPKATRETVNLLFNTWKDIAPGMDVLGSMLGSDNMTRSVVGMIKDSYRAMVGKAPTRPNKFVTMALASAEETGEMPGISATKRAYRDVLGTANQANDLSHVQQEWVAAHPGKMPTDGQIAAMIPDSDFATLHGMIVAAENAPPVATGLFQAAAGKLFGWKNVDKLAEVFRGVEAVSNQLIESVAFNTEQRVVRDLALRRNTILGRTGLEIVKAKIEAADMHSRLIDMEIKNPSQPHTTTEVGQKEILAEQAAAAHELTELRARAVLITKHLTDVSKGGVADTVAFPRELGLSKEFTPEVMEAVLQLHPAEFGGLLPESLFEEVLKRDMPREKATLAQMRSMQDRTSKIGPALAEASNPATGWKHDSIYKAHTESIRKYKELQAALPKKNPHDAFVVDGAVEVDLSKAAEYETMIQKLIKARAERRRGIKDGSIRPDGLNALEGEMESLRQTHRELAKTYDDIKDGLVFKRTAAPGGVARIVKMSEYSGFILHKDQIQGAQAAIGGLTGPRTQLRGLNPFMFNRFPMWLKGELIRDSVLGTANWLQSKAYLIDEHVQELDKMGAVDRRILGRAQREGTELPSAWVARHPQLMERYQKLHGAGTTDRLQNIDNYFNREQDLFRDLWDTLDQGGRIPPHVLESWKKLDYNPPMYAGLERFRLIQSKAAKDEVISLAGGRTNESFNLASSMNRKNLRFQRAWDKVRVKVVEKDVVVDKLFASDEEATAWIRHNYGNNTVQGLGSKTYGVREGRTIWGHHIAVGDAITAEDRKILDPVRGGTPIKRLNSLRQAFRDVSTQHLFESLNLYGNMVLSEEQFASLKRGGQVDAAKMYEKLPPQRELFGNLADKRVHKGVLAEINRASHSFDVLDSALEGIREAWMESVGTVPDSVVKTASKLSKAFDYVNELARTNLILKSIRTWTNNVMFSIYSDHMAGSEVFSAKGFETMLGVIDTVAPHQKGYRPDVDGTLRMAREGGIVSGAFEDRNFAYRHVMAEAMGVGTEIADLPKLAKKLADREAVLNEKLSANPHGNFVDLERDVWTLRKLVSEREKSWVKRFLKSTASLFWKQTKDIQGLPRPGVDSWLRARYAAVDDIFKLTQFRNLLSQGLAPDVAIQQVKMYSQMYSEVPWYVRAIPSPIRSLVTSFPYELSRITVNSFANRPARAIGFFSVIPALNMMNATMAGVNYERLDGILRARGAKDGLRQSMSLATTLHFFNPKNGDLDWSVDFQSVVPVPGTLLGRGLLVSAFDRAIPREGRGFMASLAGAGVGLASNFVGNNIALNVLGYQLHGNDPLTGEPLVSDDMSPMARQLAILKQAAQDILPPVVPFGRDWNRLQDAISAPVNPSTGRRFMGQSMGTEILRTITGINVRGTVAEKLTAAFGATPTKPKALVSDTDLIWSAVHEASGLPFATNKPQSALPRIGEGQELRQYVYRTMDERLSGAEREKAIEALYTFMQKTRTANLMGEEVTLGRTNKQMLDEIRRIKTHDVETVFGALPLHAQAFALMKLQAWGVGEKNLHTLTQAAKYTDTMHTRSASDPEIVADAITFLKKAAEKPAASPSIRGLLRHVEGTVLPLARIKFNTEQLLRGPKEILSNTLKGVRRNV
jgi:hypothetical protein